MTANCMIANCMIANCMIANCMIANYIDNQNINDIIIWLNKEEMYDD
ncbi:MAG: hypothetical protein WC006_02675 [Bacilli bacterium]